MASSCLYEKGISDLIQSKKYFHGALNTPSKTGKGAGLGFVVVRILVCADREGSHWFEFRESCVTCSDWVRPRAGDAKGPVGKLASHRRVLSTSCMWTLRMLLEFPYGTHQASQSSGKGWGTGSLQDLAFRTVGVICGHVR